MAKVQIIMPVTLDGFLPDKNEELMEWLSTDRNGFPYWEERATFNMYPHYGMLDLMDAKERRDNNCTFFMKVQDEKSAEYAGGVFLFRLADELVIYLLPISYISLLSVIIYCSIIKCTVAYTPSPPYAQSEDIPLPYVSEYSTLLLFLKSFFPQNATCYTLLSLLEKAD